MDILKILIIFLLIVIYSIVFWPTLNIYTHTAQNILVRINRITGEAYYCTYDKWQKINTEIDYGAGVKILGDEKKTNEFVSYEDSINQKEPLKLEKENKYSSGFKPLENDGTTKKYGSVELLPKP